MKKILVFGIVGVVIWLMVQFPHAMLNPGDLVEGHKKLNEKCLDCHAPFWGIKNEKCIACHKLSDIGKDTLVKKDKILFHQNLANQPCTSCHTDHMGLTPDMPLSSFNHDMIVGADKTNCASCHNKPVDNLHKQVSANCNNCHITKGWKADVTFNHDMIQGADKNNCTACHQKPTDSYHLLFKDNCDKCHSTAKWVPSTFDHTNYFRLDQNHNAACNTCHTNNNFSIYTCYGCHEHSESKIREKHTEEGIYNFASCASCHKSGNEHDIEMNGKSNNGLNKKDVNGVKEFIRSNEKEGKQEHDDD